MLVDASTLTAAGNIAQASRRWIDSDTVKRSFDLVGATVITFFFLPAMVLIAVLLKVCHGGPVLYRHRRIGRDNREFSCLKFRTMHLDSDAKLESYLAQNPEMRAEWESTQKLRKDPRVLGVGRILRLSSLDELPQLFNVIVGQMSLVGPRPIIRSEVHNYGHDFRAYLSVRPGLTGLWQVSGRNNTTYAERVEMDVRYARERTLAFDIGILLRTVKVVLTGHGAY